MNNLSVVMDSLNDFRAALDLSERGLAVARRVGDRGWEASFLAGRAGTLFVLGRWEEALEGERNARDASPGGRYGSNFTPSLQIAAYRGDAVAARNALEAEREQDVSHEDPQTAVAFAISETVVLLAERKPQEALAASGRALALRERLGATFIVGVHALATALKAAHEAADERRLRDLLALVDRTPPGQLGPFLRALRSRYRALTTPDASEADREFGNAEDSFRETGTAVQLAETLVEHAESLGARGDHAAAAPLLEEATEIFERIGATPWLERARRAAGVVAPVEALA